MTIYQLLRILVANVEPRIHTAEMDASVKAFREAGFDLIKKLEHTNALGSLASDMEGWYTL